MRQVLISAIVVPYVGILCCVSLT